MLRPRASATSSVTFSAPLLRFVAPVCRSVAMDSRVLELQPAPNTAPARTTAQAMRIFMTRSFPPASAAKRPALAAQGTSSAEHDLHVVDQAIVGERYQGALSREHLTVQLRRHDTAADTLWVLHRDLVRGAVVSEVDFKPWP